MEAAEEDRRRLDREHVDRGVGRLLLLEDLLAEVVVARLDERVRRDRDLDALLEPLLEVDQLLPLLLFC